jgi:hypothetical protein
VEGSSEITVAPTGHALQSPPELNAQTAHRSWADDEVGRQAVDERRVDRVQAATVGDRLADLAVDLHALERSRVSVADGRSETMLTT